MSERIIIGGETAAVGKRIRRHVQHTHDERRAVAMNGVKEVLSARGHRRMRLARGRRKARRAFKFSRARRPACCARRAKARPCAVDGIFQSRGPASETAAEHAAPVRQIGAYAETRPDGDLGHFVEAVWVYRAPSLGDANVAHRILPEPGVSLSIVGQGRGRWPVAANAGWRVRDQRFLGTTGRHDAAALRLRASENELVAAVSESFGGWAFTGAIEDQIGLAITP